MNNSSEKQLSDLIPRLLEAIKQEVEVKIPCEVTKVTSRKKVTVRPLIKIVDKKGNTYSREVIEGVPVFTGGAGGLLVSFPVKVGNIGWIEASDRDLSLFLQSFSETEPSTKRMHSFSDGLFVPDIMTNFTIAEEDADAVVMQNRSGSVKITLDDNSINVINGSVNISINNSKVTGIAPGGFDLNGFIINADGSATSPVSVGAPTIAATTSLTVIGVEQAAHVHGGVDRGNSNTDPVS